MNVVKTAIFTLLILISGISLARKSDASQQPPPAPCSYCSDIEPIRYKDSLAFVINNPQGTSSTALIIATIKHLWDDTTEIDLHDRIAQRYLAHLTAIAALLAGKLSGSQNYRLRHTILNGHLCLLFDSQETIEKP